jgi:DNA-binding PadR family transcriptional regulator
MSTDYTEPAEFGSLSGRCRDLLRVVHHIEIEGDLPTGDRIKDRLRRQYPDGVKDPYSRLKILEEKGLIEATWHTGRRKIWYTTERGKVTIGRLKSLYDH